MHGCRELLERQMTLSSKVVRRQNHIRYKIKLSGLYDFVGADPRQLYLLVVERGRVKLP